MIQRVEVRNFQSLAHVELEPGPLTVVVGKSSSGKSALMRAMRTMTSNRRGVEFISHGERQALISVQTERGTVALTRGKAASDNAYTVIPADPGHPLAPQRIFTKLGGDVPSEVSEFLGIEAKDPINYAGQFDKPYLLDESAGEVARTLGALTNVNVIFEAARESNRRKLAHAATLRTKADDLQAIQEKIPTYRSLKAQDAALTRAEQLIAEARGIERDIARLSEALEQLDIAEQLIKRLKPLAERSIPSDDDIVAAHQQLTKFTAALKAQQAARAAHASAQALYRLTSEELADAETAYRELTAGISENIAAWFVATAETTTIEDTEYLTIAEAVRVATAFLEEQAK